MKSEASGASSGDAPKHGYAWEITKQSGHLVVNTVRRAKRIEEDHHVISKTASAVSTGARKAGEFDEKHQVSERAAAGAASALDAAKELDDKHHLREKAARAIVSFLRTANKIIKPGDREGEKGDASDASDLSARVGTTAQQRAAASADAKLPVATAVPI